jgi:hypothetical protein
VAVSPPVGVVPLTTPKPVTPAGSTAPATATCSLSVPSVETLGLTYTATLTSNVPDLPIDLWIFDSGAFNQLQISGADSTNASGEWTGTYSLPETESFGQSPNGVQLTQGPLTIKEEPPTRSSTCASSFTARDAQCSVAMSAPSFVHGSQASFTVSSDLPNQSFSVGLVGEDFKSGDDESGTTDGNGNGSGTVPVPTTDVNDGLYSVGISFNANGTTCDTTFTSPVAPPASP